MNEEVYMADMIVSFSIQQQQEVEAIVIDKDGAEALRYLSDLVGILKSRRKPRLWPQGGRRPSGPRLRRRGRGEPILHPARPPGHRHAITRR